jgi:hypothetical protein
MGGHSHCLPTLEPTPLSGCLTVFHLPRGLEDHYEGEQSGVCDDRPVLRPLLDSWQRRLNVSTPSVLIYYSLCLSF